MDVFDCHICMEQFSMGARDPDASKVEQSICSIREHAANRDHIKRMQVSIIAQDAHQVQFCESVFATRHCAIELFPPRKFAPFFQLCTVACLWSTASTGNGLCHRSVPYYYYCSISRLQQVHLVHQPCQLNLTAATLFLLDVGGKNHCVQIHRDRPCSQRSCYGVPEFQARNL